MFWRSRDEVEESIKYSVPSIKIMCDTYQTEDEFDAVAKYYEDELKKMVNIKPIHIHTKHGDTTLGANSDVEYTTMFSPSERIKNYFDSLSQDQCTKLINQFGKMLDEL